MYPVNHSCIAAAEGNGTHNWHPAKEAKSCAVSLITSWHLPVGGEDTLDSELASMLRKNHVHISLTSSILIFKAAPPQTIAVRKPGWEQWKESSQTQQRQNMKKQLSL